MYEQLACLLEQAAAALRDADKRIGMIIVENQTELVSLKEVREALERFGLTLKGT